MFAQDVDVEAHAQTVKRYIVDSLPADLPFAAPSYLAKRMEEPKTSCFKSFSLVGTKDYFFVSINIVTVLLAVVLSAARSGETVVETLTAFEFFLRIFATIYPGLAVIALLTRANEMTLRKEMYYLMMKYKILIDWDNWAWFFGARGTRKICKTFFLWGWIISAALLCIFAWRNVTAYVDFLEEACPICLSFAGPSGGTLYQILVLVFILIWGLTQH